MRLLTGNRFCLILALILPLVALIAALLGSTSLSFTNLLNEGFSGGAVNSQDFLILREIRLPRVLLSGLVGAVLAMSGAILQGLFRNPLADPSLIGVTSGASVGASLSIFFGIQISRIIQQSSLAEISALSAFSMNAITGLSVVTTGAFLGGMLAVTLVYRLSTSRVQGTSVTTMLLVGIAISALAAALNNLMSFLADNEMMRRMSLWQMGNLDLANWQRIKVCLPIVLLFIWLLKGQAKHLNALLLGESEARHLGVDILKMKRRLIFLAALGAGGATALAGTIAFVGLIVPHLVRLISGPDHRHLILASGLLGAILLIVADLIARMLLAPAELPVGIITAFLGVPFFITLLRHQRPRGF